MKLQIGKAKVEIISNVTPKERKENLKNIYDTVNRIADKKRAEGINVDDWFYTAQELENLKKSNSSRLIY